MVLDEFFHCFILETFSCQLTVDLFSHFHSLTFACNVDELETFNFENSLMSQTVNIFEEMNPYVRQMCFHLIETIKMSVILLLEGSVS